MMNLSELKNDPADYLLEYKRLANERGIYGNDLDDLPGQHDDLDAYRHVYTSAYLAYIAGSDIAEGLGDLNEVVGGNPEESHPAEVEMDQHNNRIGREIAERANSLEELADLVAQAIKNGETINRPLYNDPFEGTDVPVPQEKPQELENLQTIHYEDLPPETQQSLIDMMTDKFKKVFEDRMPEFEQRITEMLDEDTEREERRRARGNLAPDFVGPPPPPVSTPPATAGS